LDIDLKILLYLRVSAAVAAAVVVRFWDSPLDLEICRSDIDLKILLHLLDLEMLLCLLESPAVVAVVVLLLRRE